MIIVMCGGCMCLSVCVCVHENWGKGFGVEVGSGG